MILLSFTRFALYHTFAVCLDGFATAHRLCRLALQAHSRIFICNVLNADPMQNISINFQVPQGWHELDDEQLRYVYSLIAKEFSSDEIKTLALLHFSGCKVIARHDKNSFLLKLGKDVFQTSGTLIAEVIPSLGWLDAIPALYT